MLEREHSELSRASRNKKSIFFKRTYHTGSSANELALKAKDDKFLLFGSEFKARSDNCVGRSIIEMLGVLAIIGVLTAGGIAGFTKAMRMYRSNIQKELLVQIFANAINLRSELAAMKNNVSDQITYIFDVLGLVPDGITYKYDHLYDKDGNKVDVNYGIVSWKNNNGSTSSRLEYVVRLKLQHNSAMLSPSAEDFCENAIFVAQQNIKDIEKITMYQYDKDAINGTKAYAFAHDKIRNMTLSEVHDFCRWCSVAADKNCEMYIYIYP